MLLIMSGFSDNDLHAAADGLRAIAHPLRLSVLCHLADGPKNVGELLELTKVAQPNLSQHLAKLRMLGVVQCERRSQHIYYRISDPGFVRIIDALRLTYCSPGAAQQGASGT